MKKTQFQLLTAASAVALIGLTPVASRAQAAPQAPGQKTSEAGAGLEEIVVTAQHRSENLQNVPIAVTVLTGASLAQKGVADTESLQVSVPGLTYSTLSGAAAPRIRGVGTTIAGGGNEASVATYVDGVYIASPSGSIMDFNNISQVAVLKGPQGTLFGRNATGGLIQITTQDPSHSFHGDADVKVGNHGTYGGDVYVTGELAGPIASDLAIHFNDQTEGFGKNLYTGSAVSDGRDIALRSKTKADLGANTVATFAIDYDDNRLGAPAYRPITSDLGIGNSSGVAGAVVSGSPFNIDTPIDPRVHIEQWGVGLMLVHQFDFAKLVSITAYRHTVFNTNFDANPVPIPLAEFGLSTHEADEQFSQEVRLESPSTGRFTWQVGAYYFHSPVSNFYGIAVPGFGLNELIYTTQKSDSIAGFGQGAYHFTDQTSLTLGFRYTSETKKINGHGEDIFTGFTLPAGPYRAQLTVNKPTWRAVLDHKLAEHTLVYFSYDRGFKSGGFDPTQTAAAASFKPEVLDAYEVGLKTELFDRRLRFNGAAFYYDYSNIQLNQYVNGLPVIYNGKSATIYGADFDVTALVTHDLTLTGGLSLLHSEFGEFPISFTSITPGAFPLGNESAKGKTLPNSPDYQVNLGVDYVVHLQTGRTRRMWRSGRCCRSADRQHRPERHILLVRPVVRPARKPRLPGGLQPCERLSDLDRRRRQEVSRNRMGQKPGRYGLRRPAGDPGRRRRLCRPGAGAHLRRDLRDQVLTCRADAGEAPLPSPAQIWILGRQRARAGPGLRDQRRWRVGGCALGETDCAWGAAPSERGRWPERRPERS